MTAERWVSNRVNDTIALDFGLIASSLALNKFGRSTNVDSGVATDIWDLTTQAIWTAPTQARKHNIVSTSTDDDVAGVGAKTLQIYGLTSWGAAEVSEVITMDGTSNVSTLASYVIIHRIKVLTKGASGPNVGTITATAVTDASTSAQINPAEGQTQMAIYGVPSTHSFFMRQYYVSAIKAASSLSVKVTLLVNPEPDVEETKFLVKHTIGIATEGSNYVSHKFDPFFKITGPAIIKVQGDSSANNTDVSAGFDGHVIANTALTSNY